jgi:hypothetical protein
LESKSYFRFLKLYYCSHKNLATIYYICAKHNVTCIAAPNLNWKFQFKTGLGQTKHTLKTMKHGCSKSQTKNQNYCGSTFHCPNRIQKNQTTNDISTIMFEDWHRCIAKVKCLHLSFSHFSSVPPIINLNINRRCYIITRTIQHLIAHHMSIKHLNKSYLSCLLNTASVTDAYWGQH